MLRLLPLIVGERIPESEPAWLLLLNLKDIVELVLSPVHTDSTICFLDSKIFEHRQRFQEVFTQERLIPKHHFLEHYPQLIKAFGRLVFLWTMRFEAKHEAYPLFLKHSVVFISEASVNDFLPSTWKSNSSAVFAGNKTINCEFDCAKRRH